MTSYFYTFLISITPVLELRASIPLGILKYNLLPLEAFLVSVLGGILVSAILLITLPTAVKISRSHCKFLEKLFEKAFTHTRKKHSKKMALLGDVFLVILVAIPLPGSGAFTGSLLAYLFGIKFKKALGLISLGVIISGIIITFITIGGTTLWASLNANVVAESVSSPISETDHFLEVSQKSLNN